VGAVVAGVAHAVAVAVLLIGVRRPRAVVVRVHDAVVVGVIAGVADAIAVHIFLPGVRHRGAVVGRARAGGEQRGVVLGDVADGVVVRVDARAASRGHHAG